MSHLERFFFFVDEGSQRSVCSTTDRRNKALNLILVASDRIDMASNLEKTSVETNDMCACNVTGRFKLKIKDIRLYEFDEDSCPSISMRACKNNVCKTAESNCSNRVSLNRWVLEDAKTGFISLTGLSNLYSPSLIWIQIIQRSEYKMFLSPAA